MLANFNLVELSQDAWLRVLFSAIAVVGLWLVYLVAYHLGRKTIRDRARFYRWRRTTAYTCSFLVVAVIGAIWFKRLHSLATVVGLASAGLAIAMHDTIANLTGFFFIMLRAPFKVGDRIEIGGIKGDVIDVRLFQFSVIEIGNWVDAEQSTGRIVHIPNSRALRDPLANYETGFEYIWHEVPVLITFESNWQKAKQILLNIANEKAGHLSEGVQEQIRRAAMRYLIYFRALTPTVYTAVRDSGVLLTIRYIVKPRTSRGSEQDIWEAVLTEFAKHDDISLAYPTTRFYSTHEAQGRTRVD